MAIPRERVGELFQQLKAKFIDTVNPEELEKEEISFDERMKNMTDDHGHDEHDHHHDHHGSAHDTELVEEHSRKLEKKLEEAVSRAVYCKKVFEIQADLSREAFEAAVAGNVLQQSFFENVKSVASFGCGPAPELIGFQAFLGGLPKECQPSGKVELVGYDAEEGWKEFVNEVGCTFKCNKIDAKFIEEMPNYDIIILCYSAHHLPFNKTTEAGKTMWQMLSDKGKLLVVVDFNIRDQDEALKREQFTLLKIKETHPMIHSFSVLGYFKMTTRTIVRDVYERLYKKFVEQVSEEDLKEGERLFFEHAGDEECHDHDDQHSHGDGGADSGHDHHHCPEDECDPEMENRNMKLPLYRAYWCKNLFVLQAGLVKEAFKVITEKQVVDKTFFKQVKSVAGIGCGPASDLIGFKEFLWELPQENRPASTPALVGIDAEEGWGAYVVETGCTFACDKVDTEFLKKMPKYDVIIMCCFAVHMGLANEKNNLDLVTEKCKLLMILDFDDPALDGAMKERQFFRCTLPGKTEIWPGYELNVHAKCFGDN